MKKPTAPDPIAKALDARRKTHGDFAEQAHIAQEIKGLLRRTPNWDRLSYAQREALEHDATKTARILCGNPREPDHWLDKAGYAHLVYTELTK